jgi:hypothetical protein
LPRAAIPHVFLPFFLARRERSWQTDSSRIQAGVAKTYYYWLTQKGHEAMYRFGVSPDFSRSPGSMKNLPEKQQTTTLWYRAKRQTVGSGSGDKLSRVTVGSPHHTSALLTTGDEGPMRAVASRAAVLQFDCTSRKSGACRLAKEQAGCSRNTGTSGFPWARLLSGERREVEARDRTFTI